MKVAEENGGLGTSDDEDDEDQEKESVHVVDVWRPDGAQDEKQLNENAPKRQNSAHDDSGNGLQYDRRQLN